MHIRQLRIQNLACFEDVTFDFTDDSGKPCKWIVILGENGTGKSTALRAIVACIPSVLVGEKSFAIAEFQRWFRGSELCHIDLIADAAPDNTGITAEIVHWTREMGEGHLNIREWNKDLAGVATCFIAAYRPWRSGRRLIETGGEATSYAIPGSKDERTASLFDDYKRVTSIREWLADLDYRRLKETGKEKKSADAAYKLAVRAIEGIFPKRGIKIIEVTPTKDVILEEDGVRVSIDSLSDGYQSAMNWIGDLVRRLVEAFPDMKKPLEAHGVVLVDEIDLHLHPSWQRSIVDQVRTIFPNLQFIVTTHSPFIAQDMTEHDKLIALRREGDHVTVTEDKGFVQGWRVDQILTSYLFGLEGTRGDAIQKAESTRRTLLNKQAQSSLSEEEKQVLDRVNTAIANGKSGPEERASLNGSVDAALGQAASDLLALIASRQPKA